MFDNGAVSFIQGGQGARRWPSRRAARWRRCPTFRPSPNWAGRACSLSTWFGLAAPKGTPPAVVDKLSGAITAALQKPDVAKRLQDMGCRSEDIATGAFGTFWKSEIDRYRGLVKLCGAKIRMRTTHGNDDERFPRSAIDFASDGQHASTPHRRRPGSRPRTRTPASTWAEIPRCGCARRRRRRAGRAQRADRRPVGRDDGHASAAR